MNGQWLKAKGLRVKHFYVNGKALCGSNDKPTLDRLLYCPYCRRCKTLKGKLK